MYRRAASLLAAVTVAGVLLASPAHAATTSPPGEVAAVLSAPTLNPVTEASSFAAITWLGASAATYNVQRGDILSRIAARYCGRASAYRSIGAASGIGNFDLIYPGEHVVLKCTSGVAPARKATRPTPAVVHAQTASVAVGGSAGAVVAYAEAQVGKRYVWGTAGPGSFDCSGLLVAAFAHIGVRLPHQSSAIAGYGHPVTGPLQPGDVLFLAGRGGVYHVILYIGGGQIVEAASPGQGVIRHAVYPYSFARRLI